MKIKMLNGEEREITVICTLNENTNTYSNFVLWSDIKPIIDELQKDLAALENEQMGVSDYSVFTN